jgi:hypothetical protein
VLIARESLSPARKTGVVPTAPPRFGFVLLTEWKMTISSLARCRGFGGDVGRIFERNGRYATCVGFRKVGLPPTIYQPIAWQRIR